MKSEDAQKSVFYTPPHRATQDPWGVADEFAGMIAPLGARVSRAGPLPTAAAAARGLVRAAWLVPCGWVTSDRSRTLARTRYGPAQARGERSLALLRSPVMTYLGLDVSKQMFDATLLTATGTAHHHRFSNAPNGFELLQKWLGTHGVTTVHACMAATNIDWVALTKYLYALGYTVRVVNPARIKGFAMSEMQRNKNDKLDSATIAQFCLKHHPIMRSTIPKSSCWPTHSQASPNMQA